MAIKEKNIGQSFRTHKLINEDYRDGDCKIFMTQTSYQKIMKHLSEDKTREYGGLLVGYESESVILITKALLATETEGSISKLVFTEATWVDFEKRIDKLLETDHHLRRLGWYHSHPNHGIFLSRYDLDVCSNFDRNTQVALVVDPIQNKGGFFIRGKAGYSSTSYVGFTEIIDPSFNKPVVDWKNIEVSEKSLEVYDHIPFLTKFLQDSGSKREAVKNQKNEIIKIKGKISKPHDELTRSKFSTPAVLPSEVLPKPTFSFRGWALLCSAFLIIVVLLSIIYVKSTNEFLSDEEVVLNATPKVTKTPPEPSPTASSSTETNVNSKGPSAQKPEVKPTQKPEVKLTQKPEVKPTQKPEVKPTQKPEVKPTQIPEVNTTDFEKAAKQRSKKIKELDMKMSKKEKYILELEDKISLETNLPKRKNLENELLKKRKEYRELKEEIQKLLGY